MLLLSNGNGLFSLIFFFCVLIVINIKKKGFEFFGLKNHIEEIKEKYINGIFQQSDKEIIKKTKSSKKLKITKIKKHCEFCRKEIISSFSISGTTI